MGAMGASSVFHVENTYASGERKRPRGPRPSTIAKALESKTAINIVPRTSPADLKIQATMYFVRYHLPAFWGGVFANFLPSWLPDNETPMLDLAFSSMALAVFSRTQQHPTAALQASLYYHQLLQLTRASIISLSKTNIDACLIAVFFMSRYEDVMYRPNVERELPFPRTLRSFSHHDGAKVLLRIWKSRLSRNTSVTEVIKHTRRGTIRSALLRTLPIPGWMLEGSTFGEYGLELEYDRIIVRIANIRQRLAMLLRVNRQLCTHEHTFLIQRLAEEGRDVDETLQRWALRISSDISCRQHTLSDPHPWPIRDFYAPTVYSYSSLKHSAMWTQYHATRMLILSTRLGILDLSGPNSDESYAQHSEFMTSLNIAAKDLASSVPFCLNRFEVMNDFNPFTHESCITLNTKENIKPYMASLIIWPLSIASILSKVDIEPKTWFKSELARLGKVVGVGILESANTNHWLEIQESVD